MMRGYTLLCSLTLWFGLVHCSQGPDWFVSENLNKPAQGNIHGTVVDSVTNKAIAGVKITVRAKGKSFRSETNETGQFQLPVQAVKRGEGYNVHFAHPAYQKATRAGVFRLPSLDLQLGDVSLFPTK